MVQPGIAREELAFRSAIDSVCTRLRKVLGASESGIMVLIYRDFLILVAFLVATPFSIFIFQHWLSGFAYHIDLKAVYFLTAVAVVVFISWITLAFQMIRASRVNPAVILRSE